MWLGELGKGCRSYTCRKAKIPQIVTNTGTRYTSYYIYQISYLAVKKKNGIFKEITLDI